jgi:hypothetical protein
VQTPSIGSRDFARFFRYWSILHRGRQRISDFPVSEVNMPVTCTNGRVCDPAHSKKKGVARGHAFPLMPSHYHGTSFRTPFFFLLLDSFVLSP